MREGKLDKRDPRIKPGNVTVDEVKGMSPTVIGVVGMDPVMGRCC